MLAIFLIPTALCFAFGDVVGDRRQGRTLLWAMSLIFAVCVAVVMWAEVQGNPHLMAFGADSNINMEGKESRFWRAGHESLFRRHHSSILRGCRCNA